jgi:rSAM/selenodomain-associated transferase 1
MESSNRNTVALSSQKRTLVIMAKAPKVGMVKTRLSPILPSAGVTALYRCLLEDTVALAKSLSGVELALMCPESDADELAHLLGDTVQIVTQTGDGLAAALTSVFRHFTATGQRVIAFNSDSPHIAASVLNSAFEILTTHDVVVGPTNDGGYYLVGAKAAYPSLFAGDGMGTKSALDRLLIRTKTLELSTGFTERFYDIDVLDDLMQLARELRVAPEKSPRTAAWLGEWEQAIAPLRHGIEEP